MTGLKPSTNVSELIRLPPRMLEPAAGMRSAQCRLRHRDRNGHEEHDPELDYLRAANKRSQTVLGRPESALCGVCEGSLVSNAPTQSNGITSRMPWAGQPDPLQGRQRSPADKA